MLAVVAGLIAWLALRDTGSGSSSPETTAVSVSQLRTFAASIDHPVYWVGPKRRYTYELERRSDGSILIRYLPPGVDLGAEQPYLTVATYPYADAFQAVQRVLDETGSTPILLDNNGLASVSERTRRSVHAAYPGTDYQIEVYDPVPGRAADIVRRGQLAALDPNSGSATPGPKPSAVSPRELRSLATLLDQPIYWIGPRKGYTYELTRAPGRIYIRYLPPGVDVGGEQSYLTVATYPLPGAFEAVQRVAGNGIEKIELANGGVAVLDRNDPENIHLAYPGSDYQVEVVGPPRRARQVVASGRVRSIR